jgi:Predicted nucleotide-binding protein containing TIR -like domain
MEKQAIEEEQEIIEQVFLIHGRNTELNQYVLDVLEEIGVKTLTWEQAATGVRGLSPFTLDIVKHALKTSKVVLALMTPDEIVKLKTLHQEDKDKVDGKIVEQARPNVIFEIGLMMGLADTDQKIHVISYDQCGSFTDMAGIHYIQFNSSQKDKFLDNLINNLMEDGLIKKDKKDALKLAKSIVCPFANDYSYLSTPECHESNLAAILTRQGLSAAYYDKLLLSKNVQILGVKQEGMLQSIKNTIRKHGSEFERLKEKNIQILIAGNEHYTRMIDRMENYNDRKIVNQNITNLLDIVELKKLNANFNLKMHLYANSCTIRIFDDIMWLTPYTHNGGDNSPTFIISSYENPTIYDYYKYYFDNLWTMASVSVELDDNEISLKEKLMKKKEDLKLL